MQTIFRRENLDLELAPTYHTYVLAICRIPGVTQDALARDICVNKSTVARRLDWLEAEGYVFREADKADKRCLLVYPTEKMKELLPQIKKIAAEWTKVLTSGISEEELSLFESVLMRMVECGERAVYKESAE